MFCIWDGSQQAAEWGDSSAIAIDLNANNEVIESMNWIPFLSISLLDLFPVRRNGHCLEATGGVYTLERVIISFRFIRP